MVISLERALPAAALVVWEAETLPEAFAFVDPQRRLLHPGHHRHVMVTMVTTNIWLSEMPWPPSILKPDILSEWLSSLQEDTSRIFGLLKLFSKHRNTVVDLNNLAAKILKPATMAKKKKQWFSNCNSYLSINILTHYKMFLPHWPIWNGARRDKLQLLSNEVRTSWSVK